jgi:hypothetical protein
LGREITEREFCREFRKIAEQRQNWEILSERHIDRIGKRRAICAREVTKGIEFWSINGILLVGFRLIIWRDREDEWSEAAADVHLQVGLALV